MNHTNKSKENEKLESQILETAKVLFAKNGYKKTNMSDIAAAVGINRPTLHYYYRTKDILFESVFAQLMQSFIPKIELISVESISFEEKVDRITDEYMSIYIDNPYLPQFILSEIQRDPDYLMSVMERLYFDKYLQILEKLIKNEINEGKIKDIPSSIIFLSFFSQMVSPFLSKNILIKLFLKDEANFIPFLSEWKKYVKKQMKVLLFSDEK
ncbi:MAG: TetR/AcrR family transcriptional regulator [Tannerella sp.]|jgi:AcrR family transcriptional regulator|nr:TetR/AcrR family transcriptional regulator [Tannerella sp.]